MKKLMLLVALVAGGIVVTSSQIAKADHQSGCGSGWGGGYYSSGYNYGGYYPSYSFGYDSYYPSYNYSPSFSFGYARPGVSISIGSGYRGYSYGGWGGYGGGYGGHHHHR